jgi:light-regulated signal transduction histidine kinase (bacteriophytochrome)
LTADSRRWLERIREGTRQMGRMIDDLLNLSRMGRLEPKRRLTDLRALTEEAWRDLRSEMAGRNVDLRLGKLPAAECDPALVKQVLANLLSNALKFTRPCPRAVIEVGHRVEKAGNVFYVRDNGVGFNMKHADKLFGVFQRLHRREEFDGTGVGLATVQRIIHKHRGMIWAEAAPDRGATFFFTLGEGASQAQERRAAAAAGS